MGELWSLLAGNVPALILLLVGVGLLVFEMYIPGFGVPGLLGLGTLLLGFVVLHPPFQLALTLFVILAAVLCVALIVCLVTASNGRLEKSKLALKDVALDPQAVSDLAGYVGKTGIAKSALRPAGIAEFDGARLNVVSDGEFIEQETEVIVTSVSGNRVVVAPSNNYEFGGKKV